MENLALRQQLAARRQQVKRPRVRFADRLFWAWLHRFWGRWREALILVQPETVNRWHRRSFERFWASTRWMPRREKPPSPTWRSFLDNHVKDLVSELGEKGLLIEHRRRDAFPLRLRARVLTWEEGIEGLSEAGAHLVLTHGGHLGAAERGGESCSVAERLLLEMRARDLRAPVIVFAGREHADKNRSKALALGAQTFAFEWSDLFREIERVFLPVGER